MKRFIHAHDSIVTGVLSGFDRLRFRGTMRRVANTQGLMSYMLYLGVLLKDFGDWAQEKTKIIRSSSQQVAELAGRPVIYLESPNVSKEAKAREIAKRDGVESGLICVLEAVEPCWSFDIRRNKEEKKLELVPRYRKCVHTYHYEIHPEFGFMHTRLQTWFPFNVFIWINGREWLSRQLDAAEVGYAKRDNCFVEIENVERAQELFGQQLKTNWQRLLGSIVTRVSPGLEEAFSPYPLPYYWSAQETEWATDIMFRRRQDLAQLYEKLIQHGISHFDSRDVMRFLGRKVPLQGGMFGNFTAEVVSDMRQRPEGIRIKHRINKNSIKMYDKQGSVLRIETTINNTREFKVYRRPEGKPEAKPNWLPMRKGVADLNRRATVSQAANERYLNAFATINDQQKLASILDPISKPTKWKKSRVRGINLCNQDDIKLLEATAQGEFTINGFRNRDLRQLLLPTPLNKDAQRKQSAAMSRRIRILRAHRLIAKIPKSYRYKLTTKGRQVITALNAARQASTEELLKLAA